jgi:hypothetical protein
MHNSRIITSVKPKLMINSQDVYLGITRQCAQVGLKNINIFNRKNHLGRSGRNGKNIFIKRFTSSLCAIFGIGASNDLTHNISKN